MLILVDTMILFRLYRLQKREKTELKIAQVLLLS